MTMTGLPRNITHILEVKNTMGVYTRPASMIVRITNKYADTDVKFIHKNRTVNAKSIIEIMTLAASLGTRLIVTANGSNAHTVVNELSDLFERKFEANSSTSIF